MRSAGSPARLFRKQAATAQSEGRFRDAAALYVEALRIEPGKGPVHVQAGHMFKEAGEFALAEHHYQLAVELMPDDADLALQLGHFHKTTGQLAEAHAAYMRAAALAPDWSEPRKELDTMRAAGWSGGDTPAVITPTYDPFAIDPDRAPFDPKLALSYGRMAPEQLPRPVQQMVRRSEPSLNIVQFGVHLNTFWGMKRAARGVEAIRGFCISIEPLLEVTALVNGLVVHRGAMKGPYELEYEPDRQRIHKYVFNIWYDFSNFAPGLYTLELRFRDGQHKVRTLHEDFVVEPALFEEEHPASDAIVNLVPGDPRSIEEQINGRPSAVHEAERPNMLPEIRSILVMRADQLGDLVASIPGILRLRELFPGAKLIGVFSPANVDLARSLGVFDDLIVIDFRESMELRTRTLSWEEQEALRDRLAPYAFDIAIDLSQSLMSRSLLALSGAPFLYGFKDPNWPRLSASVDDAYFDPKNRREIASHSTRIVTMIDRLAALLKSSARVIRRDDLSRARLRAFGIADADRYAVLHTGARIIFSRWTHYAGLAERLHRDTDLKIVIFTDRADWRDALPADIAASDRFVIIDRQLPFDDFDAMLSFCAVYVGNDSGPKHLASLRGVPVVSIHSARINWSEWGQEHTGAVITRKLPCAGCSIYHDVDDCGKDFVCVTAITLDDVYAVVRRYV
ncbi:glycosyltransferase family 9 protein [Sphingomonas sp. CROZ-RG-20F-R02-07]|uniref:glycosyltransferase family 9 protein n=1 Tax=Sphingomonas sp. CROZ-RG-20F-R02-07 TaxID=2914832 RepID=UPI001F55F0BF|nr:glycosyltransferase family 9 protein [Sphingomonas sp. CROZ-RG-20F-R02-07]